MKDDFPYHLERDFEKIWRKILNRWAGPVIKEIKSVLSQKEVRTDATDSPPSKAAETRVKEILASLKALSLTEKELEEIKKFYFTLNRWSYATASSAIEEVRKLRTRKKKFFPTIELDPDSRAVQQFQDSYVDFNKQLVRQLGKEWSETVTLTMSKGFLDGLGKKGLVESLIETEKIQKSKAEFWARDQLGDAYAKFTEQRFKEAGIPGYVWMTSQDNRVRDTHALLHGKFFRFTETPPGLSKPGARFPGEDYNCLPGKSIVSFDSDIVRCYRRWFDGELTSIVTESGKTIRATFNHPVLTRRGWIAIGELEIGEHIFNISNNRISIAEKYINDIEPSAQKVFDFFSLIGSVELVDGLVSQFHGDGTNEKVDVVSFDWSLPDEINSLNFKEITKLFLSVSDQMTFRLAMPRDCDLPFAFRGNSPPSRTLIRALGYFFSFAFGKLGHSEEHRIGTTAWLNAFTEKIDSHCTSTDSEKLRTFLFGNTTEVFLNEQVFINLFRVLCRSVNFDVHPFDLERFTKVVGVASESLGNIAETHPLVEKFDRVAYKRFSVFSGHVYNFETLAGHYIAEKEFILKNCRCRQRPAIDDSDALSESQRQKVIDEINRERKKFGEPKVNEE